MKPQKTAPGRLWALIYRYRTFVKYCVVGVFVTAVDFAIFASCFYGLSMTAVAAKLSAFSGAVIVSFLLNRSWTFRRRDQRVRHQFPKFLSVSVTGAGLSALTIFFQVDMIGIHPLLANGITSAIVLSWNFLANKFWTFRIVRRATFRDETPTLELSVVVPAYNEERRLGDSLDENIAFLSSKQFSWEIIVVDDGSLDGTAAIAQRYAQANPTRLRLLRQPRNRGKGAAVQLGVINACGRFVIIADADNATPIQEIDRFVAAARTDEILIGSRYTGDAKVATKQSTGRVAIGRVGNLLIRLFLIDGISDTQCGFKLFPAAVAKELFSRQRIEGWGFDMEILSIAQRMGITIREKGVTWRDVPGSRLRPIRDALHTLVELVAIKINTWSGVYD